MFEPPKKKYDKKHEAKIFHSQPWLTDVMVAARYGVHRSWPWRTMKVDPTFPDPVRLSPGMTRWRLSDLEAWEAGKTATTIKS